MLEEFDINGIEVIKCGLHASDGVEGEMVAGYYHPAFKELCEGLLYRKGMEYIIRDILLINSAGNSFIESKQKAFTFAVNPSCVSKALGHKKSNVEYFRKMGVDIRIIGDKEIPKYQCEMKE